MRKKEIKQCEIFTFIKSDSFSTNWNISENYFETKFDSYNESNLGAGYVKIKVYKNNSQLISDEIIRIINEIGPQLNQNVIENFK